MRGQAETFPQGGLDIKVQPGQKNRWVFNMAKDLYGELAFGNQCLKVGAFFPFTTDQDFKRGEVRAVLQQGNGRAQRVIPLDRVQSA